MPTARDANACARADTVRLGWATERRTEGTDMATEATLQPGTFVDEAGMRSEEMILNMGPQHPSTHGVLRLVLTLDGETVVELRPVIGYLHTGIEKNMEFRSWTQGVTFCTRMDYLSPLFNETAFCLAVEKLLGVEAEIPQRAQVLRVLLM